MKPGKCSDQAWGRRIGCENNGILLYVTLSPSNDMLSIPLLVVLVSNDIISSEGDVETGGQHASCRKQSESYATGVSLRIEEKRKTFTETSALKSNASLGHGGDPMVLGC